MHWLAAGTLPLPDDASEVRSFGGRHNNEFVTISNPLTRSTWRRENRRGLTSHDCFPGATVEAAGTTYGAQLAWSGNHALSIDWLAPGEVRLAAGESITTPETLAACGADANAVAQNFHAAIRQRMTWPDGKMKPRPVHLNTWEGFYFDHRDRGVCWRRRAD